MKKGKKTVIITIAIACFALSTIMSMQFKIVKETDITSIETMREEELRAELANWKQMHREAVEQYNEKQSKLKEYKEKQQTSEESARLVEKELEQINMYLGKTDVQGPGIVIKIKDIHSEDIEEISEEELLVIVDYLRLAGAEAIEINEKRIVNMSDMAYINQQIIYVNQERILSPYTIKAIGNPSNLESTLLGNGGYVEYLRNIGYDVDIQKENKITILKYNKEIGPKYIK